MRDIITGRMSSLSSLQAGNLILKRVEVKISEDENVRRFLTEEMIVNKKSDPGRRSLSNDVF